MFCNDNFRQEMPYGLDNDIDINITNQNLNSNTNNNMDFMGGQPEMMGTTMQSPVIEAGRERCVQRNIFHEVPQV